VFGKYQEYRVCLGMYTPRTFFIVLQCMKQCKVCEEYLIPQTSGSTLRTRDIPVPTSTTFRLGKVVGMLG